MSIEEEDGIISYRHESNAEVALRTYPIPGFLRAGGDAKCTDAWHGSVRCDSPKHETTQRGATYLDWKCLNCAGTGRETWD